MRVFRQKYRDRSGKLRDSAKWYVEIVDHQERSQRIPGFTDKKATAEFGRKLEKLVALRTLNESPTPDLTRWLESLGKQSRNRLARIGLIDSSLDAGAKALSEHLKDFYESMLNNNRSFEHADHQKSRVEKILTGCRFKFISDISAASVQRFLADARNTEEGLSIQTSNYYLQAFKQFCRWLVRERRLSESPVAHLSKLSTKNDCRRERRNLTETELTLLIETTARGPEHHNLTGIDRAMLYRVAMETGLRRGELASLTVASLELDAEIPVIVLQAKNAKNRKATIQTIRRELAIDLQQWIETRQIGPESFLWSNLTRRSAEMLQIDLEACEIPYRDDSDRVADFHALRHSFVSMLAKSGVHPKLAQKLARHSDINLTMNRYSHTLLTDEAEALRGLPQLPSVFDTSKPQVQTAKATGTDDLSYRMSYRKTIPLTAILCISVSYRQTIWRVIHPV